MAPVFIWLALMANTMLYNWHEYDRHPDRLARAKSVMCVGGYDRACFEKENEKLVRQYNIELKKVYREHLPQPQ